MIRKQSLEQSDKEILYFALSDFTKKTTTFNVYTICNGELEIVATEIKSNAMGMSRKLDIADRIERETEINVTQWQLYSL